MAGSGCTNLTTRGLQVVKQTHSLGLGKGLLGRLKRQHLDIEPTDGLGVIEVLQPRERLLSLVIKRLVGVCLHLGAPQSRADIRLHGEHLLQRIVEVF